MLALAERVIEREVPLLIKLQLSSSPHRLNVIFTDMADVWAESLSEWELLNRLPEARNADNLDAETQSSIFHNGSDLATLDQLFLELQEALGLTAHGAVLLSEAEKRSLPARGHSIRAQLTRTPYNIDLKLPTQSLVFSFSADPLNGQGSNAAAAFIREQLIRPLLGVHSSASEPTSAGSDQVRSLALCLY